MCHIGCLTHTDPPERWIKSLLRAKVREGLADPQTWNQAFQMWKDCANDIDFASYKDARIHLIVHLRGREETPGNCDDAAAQKREWLWRGDFKAFINTANAHI
jgi:hypothetical protein